MVVDELLHCSLFRCLNHFLGYVQLLFRSVSRKMAVLCVFDLRHFLPVNRYFIGAACLMHFLILMISMFICLRLRVVLDLHLV